MITRRRAMMFMAVVTTIAAALLLLLPLSMGPASGGLQPVATGLPVTAPAATVVVTAPAAPTPKSGCEAVGEVWRSLRSHHNDLLTDGNRFGTPVPGGNLSDILTSLRERACTDPTLLYDLESYVQHGFGAGHDSPGRRATVQQYWALTAAERSAKVEALLTAVQAGNPRIERRTEGYQSWYYRDSVDERIPILESSAVGPTSSTLLVFEANGRRFSLRLECGFQPTSFS